LCLNRGLHLTFKTKKIPSLFQAKGFFISGGADGARTRDLLTASQTFSQLNYGPRKSVTSLFTKTDDALNARSAFLFLDLPFSSSRLGSGIVFFCVYQPPRPSLVIVQNLTVLHPLTFPIDIGTFSQLNYGPRNSVNSQKSLQNL
jgi:hypothetical protein